MRIFKTFLATALLASASVSANATLLSIQTDANTVNAYVIPTNNDMPGYAGTVGQVGASVVAAKTAVIELTFELLFSEAAYTNTFSFNNQLLFTTVPGTQTYNLSPVKVTWNATAGDVMNFVFGTNPYGGTTFEDVSNASNGNSSLRTIFTDLGGNGTLLRLAFDDSGAGPDDDFDDMIVRVTAHEVPAPASLTLLGLGLMGIGLVRRKKRV